MVAAANTPSLAGCKASPRGVLGRTRTSFSADAPCVLARLAYSPASQDRTYDRDHLVPREDDRNELIEDESPSPDPEQVDPARDDDDPEAD